MEMEGDQESRMEVDKKHEVKLSERIWAGIKVGYEAYCEPRDLEKWREGLIYKISGVEAVASSIRLLFDRVLGEKREVSYSVFAHRDLGREQLIKLKEDIDSFQWGNLINSAFFSAYATHLFIRGEFSDQTLRSENLQALIGLELSSTTLYLMLLYLFQLLITIPRSQRLRIDRLLKEK